MGKKPRRGTFSLTFQHSNLYRMVALGNIVLQLLFPLMMAFTPTIVAARQSVLSENKATAQTSSQTNTLPDLGSSTGDISRKGSETDTLNQQREQQQTLDKSATAAQRLWGILGGPSKRDQGLDVATGMASGMANQAAQEWLNQFGNASLSFSTQGTGSADILLPLLDTPNTLLFTQPGLRRSDDRTTGNIGLGARTFTQDWMFGVNTFYDNDFTGDNRRLGVGVEAWRDYLKLSANSYFRLSDWHQSPLSSMKDYDERPANGYDVRAEAYLPGYPQLGGKLMYEHYQGKNVALDGGTSDLRDNPSAVTVGLSYTPVPLIKLGLDHTAGSGINNTNVSLGFSYRLGVPFANQLSPESVDFSRTLAGSRYDLVDRNYDIVLQYRKQDLISLLLSTSDTPYSGGSVTVTANVTTKHGLDHIVWDAPSLIAAGGTLTSLTDRSAKVNLPIVSAMAARQASPSYVVGAVAYDKNGNASNHVTLTLTPARAPQDIGSLVVTQDKSVANGVAQNTLTLTTIDTSTSQALANAVVDLAFTYTSGPNEGQSLPNQEVTTDSSGKATIGVTSILVGSVLVTATLKSNGNHTSATMSFVEDNSTATLLASNVTVNVNNAVANGLAKNSVKVVVTDSSGSPVPNAVVNFTADNGATIMATGTTGADGSLIQTLTSSKAGSSLVTATINGTTRSVSVMFIADDSSAGLDGTTNRGSSLTATSGAIANNVATNTVTATVTDHNGNPVSGLAVDFSVDSGASVVTATGTTNGSGIATTTVTASVAGAHTVTATANGSSATVSTTFVADNSSAGLDGTTNRGSSLTAT
ncbi:inverse autotransporter beta domain-containing protein, partial [Hafnia sp.]|uniref:inverse autotransporter beta domain-containing protein n=1 Tax=Hafnia sp. TaxID=1873498 RepID=UPI002FC6D961